MALSLKVSGVIGSSLVESFKEAHRICEILNLCYVELEENGGFTIYKKWWNLGNV